MRMSCGIAIVALLVSSSSLGAQFARQELHAFSSITISDTEFLKGKKDGDSVVLSGHLRLPKIGPERLPAIILLHGSGGLGGVGQPIEEWSRELNELGVATFAVDSFFRSWNHPDYNRPISARPFKHDC